MKESGTVHRWTELNRKEKPILIKQSFQFHRWSYPNIWRWSTFYKFNFYSFHNFVLFASMKRRLQVFFLRTGLHFALLFTPIPQSNANKIYTLLRIVKTSFLTLQLVIRQQDQEFEKQSILPVNKAAVAVSEKSSSYLTHYKCHSSHHNSNGAYSFASITYFNPWIST